MVHSGFRGWQRLVGRWAIEATHPAFPGTVVGGQADRRGVHRVFAVDAADAEN